MSKEKIYEALLVISTGLLVIYFIGLLRFDVSRILLVYIACGIGLSGVIFKPLGRLIALGWFKLADLLSFVMSKVVMSVVYIAVLIPVALLYRAVKKDKLLLKKDTHASTWTKREYSYTSKDLKDIW